MNYLPVLEGITSCTVLANGDVRMSPQKGKAYVVTGATVRRLSLEIVPCNVFFLPFAFLVAAAVDIINVVVSATYCCCCLVFSQCL